MKRWLFTCDEEGLTGWDGITMIIGVISSFIIPIVLIKVF